MLMVFFFVENHPNDNNSGHYIISNEMAWNYRRNSVAYVLLLCFFADVFVCSSSDI